MSCTANQIAVERLLRFPGYTVRLLILGKLDFDRIWAKSRGQGPLGMLDFDRIWTKIPGQGPKSSTMNKLRFLVFGYHPCGFSNQNQFC